MLIKLKKNMHAVKHNDLRELEALESVLRLSGVNDLDKLGGAQLLVTGKTKLIGRNRNIYDATIPPYPDPSSPSL